MFCTCVSIIALILEIVFSISAYSIVDVEEFNTKETNAFKVYIIKVLKITIFICVFSLLTILDERFYMGFIAMGIYLVIAYYISFIINLFIDWKVKTKNLIMLSDKEKKKNSAYKKVTIIAFIIIFLALILIGVMAMMG